MKHEEFPAPPPEKVTIDWDWYYVGRCFKGGKLSHGVRINNLNPTFRVSKWSEVGEEDIPMGTYLGGPDQDFKTLKEAVDWCEGK